LNEIIRDAPFGKLLRYVAGNRVFLYPEERSDFQCPLAYQDKVDPELNSNLTHGNHGDTVHTQSNNTPEPITTNIEKRTSRTADVERPGSYEDSQLVIVATVGSMIEHVRTLSYTQERLEIEEELARHKTHDMAVRVVPTKTADGTILVDW
jgi:DHA1 family multidrug resistance protein-like MFS transporter